MKSVWDAVPLSDLCARVAYGYTASATDEEVGPKFLRITDIVPNHLDWRSVPHCEIEEDELDKFRLIDGDIVIARTGATVGYAKRVTNPPESVFASYLVRVRPIQEVDSRYLGLVIESEDYKRFVLANAGGAAQPNANAKILTRYPVPLPPRQQQSKIAAAISAYDDLIDNNLRRIEILEEMAQTIYREWFVNFRFPGEDGTSPEQSEIGPMPDTWSVRSLGDVLHVLESGSRPKGGVDPDEKAVPSVGAENVLGLGKYDFQKEKYISREYFESMKRGHVQFGDVLLYKDGAKLGRKSLFRDGFPHAELAINEHVFRLRSDPEIPQSYLYFWLDLPENTRRIQDLNSNAAQPGISQEKVKTLPIIVPPNDVLVAFDEVVNPILGLLFNLARQNTNLRITRDLLLPKLISGEIDVSDLNIDTSLVAA